MNDRVSLGDLAQRVAPVLSSARLLPGRFAPVSFQHKLVKCLNRVKTLESSSG